MWTCQNGHPICGECIDIDKLEDDASTESGIGDDMLSEASSVSTNTTRDSNDKSLVDSFSGLEISSYVRLFMKYFRTSFELLFVDLQLIQLISLPTL